MMIMVDGAALAAACREIRDSTGQIPEVLAAQVGMSSGTWRKLETAKKKKRLRVHAEFVERVIDLHNKCGMQRKLSMADFNPHPKVN